jgi:hypothetical protein
VALRRVREAGEQLKVPFGYMLTEQREILEYDWTATQLHTTLSLTCTIILFYLPL